VLWWSTRVARSPVPVPKTPERSNGVLQPLDRSSEKTPDWLQSYLEELLTEQPLRPAYKRAFGWLGVSRWRAPDEPNERVHYNLACLFSRLAAREGGSSGNAHLPRSADHLERCLAGEWGARRGESARWAERDPGLRRLRELAKPRFEGIVGEGKDVRDTVPVPSAGSIRRRNAVIIMGWVLGAAALVAVTVLMFFGVPFA